MNSIFFAVAVVARRFSRAPFFIAVALVGGALALLLPNAAAATQNVHAEAVEAAVEAPPLARAGFDLWLHRTNGVTRLIYVKDSCTRRDRGLTFFVHIYPHDKSILTEEERVDGRKESEFRFWSADFSRHGDDGRCVAAQRIPDIDAWVIATGQMSALKSIVWSVRIDLSDTGEAPAATVRPDTAPAASEGDPDVVHSHLYAFDFRRVRIADTVTTGGAIERLGRHVLAALPRGELALIRENGAGEWLRASVPMNSSDFEKYIIDNPHPDGPEWGPNKWPFRVADILIREVEPHRWELFASHHYFSEGCILFRISSTTITRNPRESSEHFTVSPEWKTIFDAEPCLNFPHYGHQSGGKMLMGDDDRLLIVIGDHNRDGWGGAGRSPILPQDSDSHFGKLVSVDIASGNAEILALGLRNPQGLARDRAGRVWWTEHGPQGGDELNILEEGGNYGWPHVTYGLNYGGGIPKRGESAKIDARDGFISRLLRRVLGGQQRSAEVGAHDGFIYPAYSWVPSVGVSAIAINDEMRLPLWKNDILVATLSGKFYRIRRTGSRVIYAEEMALDSGKIRDIVVMPDGRIALLFDWFSLAFLELSWEQCAENPDTVYPSDHIYMLHCDGSLETGRERGSRTASALVPPAPRMEDAGGPAAAPGGAALFAGRCGQCHRADARVHDVGPHLVGVVGRRAGSVVGFDFSDALDSLAQAWTRENLATFLMDPDEIVPGTRMPGADLTEGQARAIVDYLAKGE